MTVLVHVAKLAVVDVVDVVATVQGDVPEPVRIFVAVHALDHVITNVPVVVIICALVDVSVLAVLVVHLTARQIVLQVAKINAMGGV